MARTQLADNRQFGGILFFSPSYPLIPLQGVEGGGRRAEGGGEGGLIFRGVGLIRAKANTALTNLVYDMCRLVQIKKCQPNLIMIQWAEYQIIIPPPFTHL